MRCCRLHNRISDVFHGFLDALLDRCTLALTPTSDTDTSDRCTLAPPTPTRHLDLKQFTSMQFVKEIYKKKLGNIPLISWGGCHTLRRTRLGTCADKAETHLKRKRFREWSLLILVTCRQDAQEATCSKRQGSVRERRGSSL